MNSLRFWKRRQTTDASRASRQRNERARLERAIRPLVEPLESRRLLAADITIIAGAAGSGTLDHFLSAANGTITTANDPGDAGATLSTGALAGVGAGVPIGIAATTNIAFNNIGSVALLTGSGATVTFAANSGSIIFSNLTNTLSTFGGSFDFVAGTALTAANLIADGGDIALTAGTAGAGNVQFTNINTSGNLTLQATNASGGAIFQSGNGSATANTINATATGAISVNALSAATVNFTSNNGSISSTGANPISASGSLKLNAAEGITVNTSVALISALNSTSGNVSITQLASPALAMATTSAGIINEASSGAINVTNLGGTITVTSGSPISSTNGSITLLATDLKISAAVSSGTGRTTLANSVAGIPINLGTANVPNSMGITQADLNNITAAVTQIGSPTAGAITISNTISGGTLQLFSNGSVSETTSPAAGMFNVTSLTIDAGGSVTLANNTQTTSLIINAAGSVTLNQVESTDAAIDSNSGSISSSGFSPIGASSELTLDAATGIMVNISAASLEAINSTSGNINITQAGAPAMALSTFGTGVVNDASGGTTTIDNPGSTLTIANGAPIATVNGSITLLTNDFTISGAVNSGTAVTTLGNSLFGTPINLGDANVANSIGITQADLNNITAGVVRIGTPTAGAITISQSIVEASLSLITDGSITETSTPGLLTVTNLRISAAGLVNLNNANAIVNVGSSTNGSAFIEDGNTSLNVPAAGVDGVVGVTTNNASIILYSSGQSVTTFAPISASDSTVEIVGGNSVTVDQVQGTTDTLVAFTGSVSSAGANPIVASTELAIGAVTGITVNCSTPAIDANNSTSGNIFITQLASPALALATISNGVTNNAPGGLINITNLGGSFTVASGMSVATLAGGAITLLATDFTIAGAVNSGAATTTLGNSVAGNPINLGTASVPGAIGIAQTDLNNITAHVLRVGTPTAGAITISAAISDSALSLINSAAITESGGSLSVANLRISSSGPVTFTNANNVTDLASSTNGAFLISNGANPLTIPSAGVDGVQGIATNNAPITITMAAGALTVNANVSSGGNAVNATVRSLTVANGVTLDIGTGSIRVDYGVGNASPVAMLVTYLKSGYNNGLWTGTQITSSTAAAHSADAVGYADGSIDSGTSAAAGQVLIQYTLNGDANLDGFVNFADLVAVVQNFNKGGTDWSKGNFAYGSSTNFGSLVAVVQNFNKILAPAAGSAVQTGGTTIPIGRSTSMQVSTQVSTPLAEKAVNNPASNPATSDALPGSDADSAILDNGYSEPLL